MHGSAAAKCGSRFDRWVLEGALVLATNDLFGHSRSTCPGIVHEIAEAPAHRMAIRYLSRRRRRWLPPRWTGPERPSVPPSSEVPSWLRPCRVLRWNAAREPTPERTCRPRDRWEPRHRPERLLGVGCDGGACCRESPRGRRRCTKCRSRDRGHGWRSRRRCR
jgi:hypothetical protein